MEILKKMMIWICMMIGKPVSNRLGKMPVAASGGVTGTSSNYRSTWVSYDEAERAKADNGFAGIAFVVPDGYFFLDIDHRDLNDPLVLDILDLLPTYTERSVSGSGLHLYGKYDLSRIPTTTDKDGSPHLDAKYYSKNPNNQVELYFGDLTSRCAVYTGNTVNNADITDCTDGILTLLEKYMRKSSPSPQRRSSPRVPSPRIPSSDYTADAIIKKLRKQRNGAKFERLYDRGDIDGYPSQSEADLALCAIIAFRAGPNADMIDLIFRGSALYRDKWEREDYRTNTITAAINRCNGNFYDPSSFNGKGGCR